MGGGGTELEGGVGESEDRTVLFDIVLVILAPVHRSLGRAALCSYQLPHDQETFHIKVCVVVALKSQCGFNHCLA